jgi:hypothetical protein
MEAIHNFKDHPSLRYTSNKTIYLLERTFYLADADRLCQVYLTQLGYTNMGEPYEELARLEFMIQGTQKSGAIDIEMKDAFRLDRYCQSIGYKLDVSAELKGNREFMREASK